MDFDELLKQQQAWLKRAGEALKRPGAGSAPELPLQLRERRIEGARVAVDRLTRQRDEIVRRLDAAIAEERSALKRLEEEGAKDGKPTRPVKRRRPTPQPGAKSKKASSK